MAKVVITIEDLGNKDRVKVTSTPSVQKLLTIKKGGTLSPCEAQAIIALYAILKNTTAGKSKSGIILPPDLGLVN